MVAVLQKPRKAKALIEFGPECNGMLMTPEEFDRSDFEEGWRYELINGVLIVSPIPAVQERDPNEELGYLLRRYRDSHPQGKSLNKTLPEHIVVVGRNRRKPDRVIWAGLERMPRPKDLPTVIAEFVSKRKRDRIRDYQTKRDEFMEAGVQEYWVIDRFQRTMTIFTMAQGKIQRKIIHARQTYRTNLLPGFELRIADLFAVADDWAEEFDEDNVERDCTVTTILAVNGSCGRMGQRIIQLAHEDKTLQIGAALDAPSNPWQGRDIGDLSGLGPLGVPVTATIPVGHRVDVVIDFSMPEGTMGILKACVERKLPIVVATTGFSPQQQAEIEAAAHYTAVLMSPNMSLVVNVLFKLVRQAAEALKDKGFDAEIIERHHRFKKDSPSGTALHFAKVIQEAWGDFKIQHGREGLVGERPAQEIGMHAVRAGDNVGEHTILFSTLGETMELVHKGHTRDAYVRGALQAAKFLATRPAGRYTMADVLGL